MANNVQGSLLGSMTLRKHIHACYKLFHPKENQQQVESETTLYVHNILCPGPALGDVRILRTKLSQVTAL